MAERLRAPDSSSDVSDQQRVCSSPGRGTCVLEQDTLPYVALAALSLGWDIKPYIGPVYKDWLCMIKNPEHLLWKSRG